MKTKILIITFLLVGLATGAAYAQSITQLNPGVYEFECLTGRLRHSFINDDVNFVRLNCTTNGEGIPVQPTATPFWLAL